MVTDNKSRNTTPYNEFDRVLNLSQDIDVTIDDVNKSYLELERTFELTDQGISEFESPKATIYVPKFQETMLNDVQQELMEEELDPESLSKWCKRNERTYSESSNPQKVEYAFGEEYNGDVEEGCRHGFGSYLYVKGTSIIYF